MLGETVGAHGVYYAREWGFGPDFECKVAAEMAEFLGRYDTERDRLFSAWRNGDFLGALTIDGSDPTLADDQAHLRWFVTTDAARGTGVGGRLMAAGMMFLQSAGFRSCYLTTFAGLDAARRMYERSGFVLTDEAQAETWGASVLEQRFDLNLD